MCYCSIAGLIYARPTGLQWKLGRTKNILRCVGSTLAIDKIRLDSTPHSLIAKKHQIVEMTSNCASRFHARQALRASEISLAWFALPFPATCTLHKLQAMQASKALQVSKNSQASITGFSRKFCKFRSQSKQALYSDFTGFAGFGTLLLCKLCRLRRLRRLRRFPP